MPLGSARLGSRSQLLFVSSAITWNVMAVLLAFVAPRWHHLRRYGDISSKELLVYLQARRE